MVYIKHPYRKSINCSICNKKFIAKTNNTRFCHFCRVSTSNVLIFQNLSTPTVGTIGELMVCIDLLKKGYDVFRAISPSCSCDIAILKDKKLLRVEARTGYHHWSKDYIQKQLLKNIKTDILAIIIHKTNEIIYYPNL